MKKTGKRSIKKILIANRGEIALRITQTAKKMGIKVAAIYAEKEKNAYHVQEADEAHNLGDGSLKDTYLNGSKIIDIALNSNCDAIHPGYGFLSENGGFADACEQSGLIFIGPSSEAMQVMGNKIAAREFILNINVPATSGATGTVNELMGMANKLEYPVLIKAAAGGGGKGMRIVKNKQEINQALEATSREALNYFGDGTVYIEKFIENPRHIEIQVLADNHGNVVHLFERECSIQRRYQKIIEESPSPTITPKVREEMGAAAVKIAREIGYTNAGTIEFLMDKNLNFFFLEMNTRIQVEHPVTEMVTGVDIVEQQIRIAAGEPLPMSQKEVKQTGHAIECRVYAEQPANNFMPSPGNITYYKKPQGKNIRVDASINKATTIESDYDPMISKLVVWDENRQKAIEKTINALENYPIIGIETNISFLKTLLNTTDFKNNNISTHFCEQRLEQLIDATEKARNTSDKQILAIGYLLLSLRLNQTTHTVWKQIGYWRNTGHMAVLLDDKTYNMEVLTVNENSYSIQVEDSPYEVSILEHSANHIMLASAEKRYKIAKADNPDDSISLFYKGFNFNAIRSDFLLKQDNYVPAFSGKEQNHKQVFSPMPGKIIQVNVSEGQKVKNRDQLMVVEAMKMENYVLAPGDAEVKNINVKPGDMVTSSQPLIEFI